MGKRHRSNWAERPRAAIPFRLLDSYAYLAISHAARHAFWRLIVEHGRHAGRDNGRLACTRRDFEAWGVARNLAARAIRELVAVGLVEITRAGSAGNADQRLATHYRLTAFPAVGREGADGTHDYERIATMEDAAALVREAENPVSKRDVTNGSKGAAATKNHNSGRKSVAETGRKSVAENDHSPATDLRPQGPATDLRPLSTYRPLPHLPTPTAGRPTRRRPPTAAGPNGHAPPLTPRR
jgi:hypothetical protein